MYRLTYVSKSKIENDEDLSKLFIKSEESNRLNNISGMLIHKNSDFIQVLEGNKQVVTSLFNTIKNDNRHENIVIFYEKDIKKKYFEGFYMAFDYLSFENTTYFESLKDFNFDKILKSEKNVVLEILKTFLEAKQRQELEKLN